MIFPQAREDGDWTSESSGGKRALAILEQVRSEYRVDPNRVALTGVSMGGQGTWSLAAAEPGRWSAIVPICHGWKPNMAAVSKKSPAGASMAMPTRSFRSSSRARWSGRSRKPAGSRCTRSSSASITISCADHAYAMPELYEWLLLQDRSKR